MGSTRISGGTYVIFQHALYLQQKGWQVVIVPQEPFAAHGYKWHPAFDALMFSDFAQESETLFDVVIATWWKTVYDLPRVRGRRYIYFVQSVETWFYPDREKALRKLVADTYRLPVPVITVAGWIREYLRGKYGRTVYIARNGIRKELYAQGNDCIVPRAEGRLRVLVEGPLGIDFKNVARTIRLVRRSKAAEIWLLTGRPVRRYWGVDRVFSMVPIEETPLIYRSCDVLVKLSYVEGMFGPPLEMFHCGGTAVVYDVAGHEEYIVDGENALVVRMGDEAGVIEAINRLAEDRDLLERLRRGALATAASWPDWPTCSAQFYRHVLAVLSGPVSDQGLVNRMVTHSWNEYVAAARDGQNTLARIHAFFLRLVNAAERRIPLFEQEKRALVAWLWESRRLPESRSRD